MRILPLLVIVLLLGAGCRSAFRIDRPGPDDNTFYVLEWNVNNRTGKEDIFSGSSRKRLLCRVMNDGNLQCSPSPDNTNVAVPASPGFTPVIRTRSGIYRKIQLRGFVSSVEFCTPPTASNNRETPNEEVCTAKKLFLNIRGHMESH